MVLEKIKDIISERMEMPREEITAQSSFEGMQIDSLDMVEIVMDLEEAFDVSIETSDGLKTVADLVAFIEGAK